MNATLSNTPSAGVSLPKESPKELAERNFNGQKSIIKTLTAIALAANINSVSANHQQQGTITSYISNHPVSVEVGEQFADSGQSANDGVPVEQDKDLLAQCDTDGSQTINGKEVFCKSKYNINKSKEKVLVLNERIATQERMQNEALKESKELDKKIITAEKEQAKTKKLLNQKLQEMEAVKQEIREKIKLEPNPKVKAEVLKKIGK